ncbi:hypothetical protein [uncultured Dubosiella sp.]|uniref:hypothetical protein n=4 Tax=uncultured Dubosiella sp. TaxID=1937011 RepID=UPI00272B5516|nr:hypothetical protein [uncultured Dubosiella sp.]
MNDYQGLKSGEEHKTLRENWVVFLTKKDFLKQNELFYTYEWFNRKWKRILHTKAHIRFVNGEYRGDDAIGKLMHDFHCTNPDDMFYDELREAVSYFKKEPEVVNAMCEIMREFERESRNKEREEGMSYEKIARITNQSLSKVKSVFKAQQPA